MNTIGTILKEARINKNISISNLESSTKIKSDFILKIENEDWDNLPEFPVVSGFVKNISNTLGLSVDNISAILRRDYPPKKLRINPKPDIQNKFVWSPKLAFSISIVSFVLVVLGYLGYEYRKFMSQPDLVIDLPKQDTTIIQNKVKVAGKTTTDVILTVNNQPIILDQDGAFYAEIEVTKDTKNLLFKAISRSGKVTEKVLDIKVE